jgi:cell division protein ZapA
LSEPVDRVVPVFILGQRYPIRSTLEPAYIVELAGYVEEKMKAAAEAGTAHDTLRLAVLAALNIADEYFRAGDDVQDRQAGFAHRARELERMLDLALASGHERLAAG